MHIIRPIQESDEQEFINLALSPLNNIMTLPHSALKAQQKLIESTESFAIHPMHKHENYLFVLENLETHELEGCSAIHASTAFSYFYKVETIFNEERPYPQMPESYQILKVAPYKNGTSELCTLYLASNSRKKGLGRPLSQSRFLFIGCFPERFERNIIVEILGVTDASGESPFWNAIGRHFYDVDVKTAMSTFEKSSDYLKEILPNYPTYCHLLPKEAQEAMGKGNATSAPALKMLADEGFSVFDGIDIFDGGPKLIAPYQDVRTLKTSKRARIMNIENESFEGNNPMIVANTNLDFRACIAEVKSNHGDGVLVDRKTAQALEVDLGSTILYASLYPPKRGQAESETRILVGAT